MRKRGERREESGWRGREAYEWEGAGKGKLAWSLMPFCTLSLRLGIIHLPVGWGEARRGEKRMSDRGKRLRLSE